MNICMFSGRITKDCETRYANSGTAITSFSIAVDGGYGDNKRTEFINCVLFKREGVAQYLTKGKPLMVTGEYQEDKWQDNEGNHRSRVKVVVDKLEFQQGDSKQGGQQQPSQQQNKGGFANSDMAFPSEASGLDQVPF